MTARFSAATKKAALERADNHCEECGSLSEEGHIRYHHRIPESQGGDDSLANCKVLCVRCHETEASFLREHGRRVTPRHFFIKGLSPAQARRAAGVARRRAEARIRRELPLEIVLDPDG